MKKPKIKAAEALAPKVYPLLQEAIEEGVRYGYQRAHKHVERPTQDSIVDEIERAVMGSIFERFDILDPEAES